MHELNRISNSRTPKLWKVIKLKALLKISKEKNFNLDLEEFI